MQKYLREVLSKHATYDELEEELARREDKKDSGGFNQLTNEDPTIERVPSEAVNHDGEGGTERTVWDGARLDQRPGAQRCQEAKA